MDPFPASLTLIGIGVLTAGIVGVVLPARHRLGALLALTAGAGAGIVVLGVGVDPSGANGAPEVFLVGSAVGLATVVVCLVVAWLRAARDELDR